MLDTEVGILREETQKERLHEQENDICEVMLMQFEEFKNLEGHYPYKMNLIRSMDPVRYCKLETYGDCIQGTMKVLHWHRKKNTSLTFGFYLKDNLLIFVEQGNVLSGLMDEVKSRVNEGCSLKLLLLLMFELLIEEDVLYLQKIEESLNSIEENLLIKIPSHFYETIIIFRKNLSALHAYYEQLMNIGDIMRANIYQKLTAEESTAWHLYTNRVERLHDHAEILREYLLQIRELYQSQIDVQQNKVMSVLTIVTTIFLPLTLIVGWYGMNFPNMPEFQWKYGYQAIIMVCVLIVVCEIIYFKRKKML